MTEGQKTAKSGDEAKDVTSVQKVMSILMSMTAPAPLAHSRQWQQCQGHGR